MYEGWRDVPGYEGLYQINAEGQVFSFKSKKILATSISKQGYKRLGLYRIETGLKKHTIHQLVALSFHGPCPEGHLTRHKDGDKLNNHPSNVIWGTPQENSDDNALHGGQVRGSQVHKAKLTEAQVLEIYHSPKTQGELAKEYGMSQVGISYIKRGINWRHVTQ